MTNVSIPAQYIPSTLIKLFKEEDYRIKKYVVDNQAVWQGMNLKGNVTQPMRSAKAVMLSAPYYWLNYIYTYNQCYGFRWDIKNLCVIFNSQENRKFRTNHCVYFKDSREFNRARENYID